MSSPYCVMVIRLFVLFIIMAGSSKAVAQQGNEIQNSKETLPMTMAVVANESTDTRKNLFDLLRLYVFEASFGNSSACTGHSGCLEDAKRITNWLCASRACDGTDKNKTVFDCGELSNKYSKEIKERLGSSYCFLIKSPSAFSRQTFLKYFSNNPHATDEEMVEYGAYLMALKGSAESCENYIKNYVGAYGPRWTYKWYRRMSGCRILAGKRTREQEEKDFNTWFDVMQGSGKCSDIVNSEMLKACSAPGAASPIPLLDYIK